MFRRRPPLTTGCLLAALTAAAAAIAQEPEALHPIAQTAADTLADPDSPFVMVVTFRVKDGATDAFVAAMAEPRLETAKEPGNVDYALSQGVAEPNVFLLHEHWKNLEALDSHLRQPYLVKLGEALADLVEAPPQLDFFVPVP